MLVVPGAADCEEAAPPAMRDACEVADDDGAPPAAPFVVVPDDCEVDNRIVCADVDEPYEAEPRATPAARDDAPRSKDSLQ